MFHNIKLEITDHNGQFRDYSDDIKSYTAKYDMFASCSTITFNLVFAAHSKDVDFIYSGSRYMFVSKDNANLNRHVTMFRFSIDEIPMMLGFIDSCVEKVDKGSPETADTASHELTMHGRDMMQVLVDNHIIEPTPYNDLTLDSLLKQVWTKCNHVDYTVTVSGSAGVKKKVLKKSIKLPAIDFPNYSDAIKAGNKQNFKFNVVKQSYGETLFDFYKTKLNELGMFIYNVPGTDRIMIHQAPLPIAGKAISSYDYYSKPVSDTIFVTDSSLKKLEVSQDISAYYKFIRLTGSSETLNMDGHETTIDLSGDVANPLKTWRADFTADIISPLGVEEITDDRTMELVYEYNGVPKIGVVQLNDVNEKMWHDVNNQKILVGSHLLSQGRAIYECTMTVAGHGPIGSDGHFGKPFFFNRVVGLRSYIQQINLLIYGVEFNGSKESGQTATLSCGFPVRLGDERTEIIETKIRNYNLQRQ